MNIYYYFFFREQIALLLITIKVLDYFAYSTCKAEENPFPVIGKIVNWLRKWQEIEFGGSNELSIKWKFTILFLGNNVILKQNFFNTKSDQVKL